MGLGPPRGGTDERHRRSALNHGTRKLGRSHGRRGRDVYKYYMRCMEGPNARIARRNDISLFLPLWPWGLKSGYPLSVKFVGPVFRRVQLCAS
jgi:hypothetical protein